MSFRERIQSLLWFMPLPYFAAGFVLYLTAGTFTMAYINDTGLLASFIMAAVFGVALTVLAIVSKSFFTRDPVVLDPEPQPELDNDQVALRKRKRQDLVKREARKMHNRVINMGAVIAAICLVTWLYFNSLDGATPSEVFVVPLWMLVVVWFLTVVLLPPWMTYSLLFAVVGMRFAFELWGSTILILLPNFLMLPFFYFFMMIFMFGSMMIPNFMQFKFYRPGDATWEVPKGTMRGQPEARAIVEMEMEKFENHAAGRTDRPATRGMIFEGPPGTGKTLLAKELGTEYDLPFAFTDAQAFNAPFMGFAALIVYYFRWRTESLAKEYGGAIVFIDEAEQLLQQRSGMGQPGMGGSMNVWDMLPHDERGRVQFANLLIDEPGSRERYLSEISKPISHPIFMGGMGGGGGAGAAIFPFLTWLNGADGPPMMKKMYRRKFNDLLNALFIPTIIKGKILRLPPGKPVVSNIMFIAATNRAWMLDDAIRRPGRFGVTVRFKTPDFKSRVEVADLYFNESVNKGWMAEELNTQERYEELARSTQGMSPAEIEAVIKQAPDVRIHHVENLKRIKKLVEAGITEEEMLEDDRKYWKRFKDTVNEEGWDDYAATWEALMEARSQILWGRATPGITSEAHRESTAVHEFMGHFIQLKAFMGDHMRPQVLTVMPRGSALGMVAYVPVEERDPMPQSFYEAMLRVSVGSVLAERFFYGENQPGVIGDLENATSVATFMVAKCAMVPYGWGNQDDRIDYYQKIGESLRAVSDSNPMAKSVIDKVMSDPSKRKKVEVFLGMAAVDSYRLIRLNASLSKPVVDELLEVDEFSGQRLEDLWSWLDDNLITLTDYRSDVWPDRHFAAHNPFYGTQTTEAEEILNA